MAVGLAIAAAGCAGSDNSPRVSPLDNVFGLDSACVPLTGETFIVSPGELSLDSASGALTSIRFVRDQEGPTDNLVVERHAEQGLEPGDLIADGSTSGSDSVVLSPLDEVVGDVPGDWVLALIVRTTGDEQSITFSGLEYVLDEVPYRIDDEFELSIRQTC